MRRFLMALITITSFAALSGCQGIRNGNTSDTVSAGRVQVMHWLDSFQTIDLDRDGYITVANALSKTRSLTNETAKRSLRANAKDGKLPDVDANNLLDNCILITRSGQLWYFPKAMLALPEFSGIRLRNNDQVFTMPFSKTIISGIEDLDEVTIQFINRLEGTKGELQVTPLIGNSIIDPNIKKVASNSAITLAHVQTIRNDLQIHIVFPYANDFTKSYSGGRNFAKYMISELSASGDFAKPVYQEGDIIEFTNLGFFVNEF